MKGRKKPALGHLLALWGRGGSMKGSAVGVGCRDRLRNLLDVFDQMTKMLYAFSK